MKSLRVNKKWVRDFEKAQTYTESENITLIGTAGSDEKCKLALKYGATHCINYNEENFEEKVKEITAGAGVDVVMDSVGQSTFEGSLNCLKPLGMMITFGNASGPIPPFNLGQLGAKGSLKITPFDSNAKRHTSFASVFVYPLS